MINISVIIPIFNAEPDLFKHCLSSICAQTLGDIEIILVDDCGPERESVEYAEQQALLDSRIHVLHNREHSGVSFSCDAGIQAAQGDYVALVDAEDWLNPDFYEKLYTKAKEADYDVVKGAIEDETDPDNSKIRIGISQGKPLYTLFRHQPYTAIYRNAFVCDNKITFGRSHTLQDGVFALKASVLAHSFALVDDAFYHVSRDAEALPAHTELLRNISAYGESLQERFDFLSRHVDMNDQYFGEYMQCNTDQLVSDARLLQKSGEPLNSCLVSVIVPTFNAAEYLPDLIQHLLGQTFHDFEILFVDDGSTDDSAKIIREAMSKDARISYYYEENAGAGSARNVGLNHAKGKYIICLDSDDLYDDNLLEKLVTAAERERADVVMCLFRRHDYWLNTETVDEGYKKDRLPLNTVFCGQDIPNFWGTFNCGPINKLIRKNLLLENGLRYSCTRISNDSFLGYSALLIAQRVYCLPDNLLTVRRYANPNSISSTRAQHLEDCIPPCAQLYTWVVKVGLQEKYGRQVLRRFVSSSCHNSQYGLPPLFWDACCAFVNEYASNPNDLKYLVRAFQLDRPALEAKIKALAATEQGAKEAEMLGNKLAFAEKMQEFVRKELEKAIPSGIKPRKSKRPKSRLRKRIDYKLSQFNEYRHNYGLVPALMRACTKIFEKLTRK